MFVPAHLPVDSKVTARFAYAKYLTERYACFGTRIGLPPKIMHETIETFASEQSKVYELIEHSFLDEKVKRMYKQSYQERLHRFQRSDN